MFQPMPPLTSQSHFTGTSHPKQLLDKSQLNIYDPLHRPESNKERVQMPKTHSDPT